MENINLFKALCLFQSKVPVIEKDKEADLNKFKFKFASYANITKTIQVPLAEAGLGYTHYINDGNLITAIVHGDSGELLQSVTRCPDIASPADFGKWLTYLKRYHLTALLGLASDDDVDGDALPNDSEKISDDDLDMATQKQVELNLIEKEFCQWLCGVDRFADIPASQRARLYGAIKAIEAKRAADAPTEPGADDAS